MKFGELIESGDWKGEKHVPVIEAPDKVKAGEPFEVKVSVGKEIPHPNTVEHHIKRIKLTFKPAEGKVFEIGSVHFDVHGDAVAGAAKGSGFCEPYGTFKVKLNAPGTFITVSYCNIHGFWENQKPIAVE